MRPHVGRCAAEVLQLLRARVGARLHAVADLAVDLADELVDVALEQRLVGLRPGLLPYALAREEVVDVGAGVRSEREQQRGAGREREAQRVERDGLAQPRAFVQQLHHRRDRGVEGEPPQIPAHLVDRPVRLAQQREIVPLHAVRGEEAGDGRAGALGGLRGESPQPREEAMDPLDALVGPVGVLVGRADEQDVAAGRVRAEPFDDRGRRDDVAPGLAHLRAVLRDHALGEQRLERLLEVEMAEVGERLREEARIHQVQDRVLDPADVLVDRHPLAQRRRIPGGVIVGGVAVAQEVPRGVDERVHRVGLSLRRPAAVRAGRVHPVLGSRQRRAALGRVVVDVRQLHRQLIVGDGHHPAALAVQDRDRTAPVALPGDEPVAQTVVDRGMTLALTIEPRDDRGDRLAAGHAVEVGMRVHDDPVAGVREILIPAHGGIVAIAVRGLDHPPDRQPERARKGVVALVVRGHGHDRSGPVLHQDVVGDVHRQLLAVDRVGDGAPERDPGLRLLGVAALLAGLGERVVDVVVHLLLVRGSVREAHDVGMLWRHDEERRAEERVGTGGEHGIVDPELLAAERHLGTLAAPDPVALHRLDVLRPVDQLEVAEQPLGVVGDAQEPLLELPDFDERSAALAATLGGDLLVGEHRLVSRAPLHGGLLAVGKPGAEQLEEDPLRPAVVARFMRGELARPVDRDPP